MFQLRPYQQEAVNKLLWSRQLDGADLCILPTGAGKSLIIAELVKQIDEPILILQPTREILRQNKSKLETVVASNEIGVYSASLSTKQIKKCTLATIGSIHKKPEDFKHFNIVLLDECHLLNPKRLDSMYVSFFVRIGNPKVIGLTATPYRMYQMYERSDTGELVAHTTTKLINRLKEHFWHRIIYNISTQELINENYLVPIKYIDRPIIAHSELPTNKSRSDFDIRFKFLFGF